MPASRILEIFEILAQLQLIILTCAKSMRTKDTNVASLDVI